MGVKYSSILCKVEGFAANDPISALYVGDSHCYALATTGNVYFWGLNTHGLALD